MPCNLTYKVLPELKIIVEYFEGEITLQEMIDFQINQLKDESCKINFHDITDIRNAEFHVQKNDVRKYAEFVKQNEEKQGNRKVAIVTNKPTQTAITMLYSAYTEKLALNNRVFSTIEAALAWLGIDQTNYKNVIEALDLLKSKSKL